MAPPPIYERPRFMRAPRGMRGGRLTLDQLIRLGEPPVPFFQSGRGIKKQRSRRRRTRRTRRRHR